MKQIGAARKIGACFLPRLAAILFVAAFLVSPALADDLSGEALFGQCKACHDIGPGARHKVGPHLDGLMGRKAGSIPGFNYSGAMKAAGGSGLVWNAEMLKLYLERPRDFIPGNRMSFRGMAEADKRDALIGWLESFSAVSPADDPAAAASSGDHQAGSFADIVLALKGDRDYGEYLSGECVTCHQVSGHADGIPSIVGVPRDYFVRALFEYKVNIRSNEVMKLRVNNLGNEEIAALAEYFGTLSPQ
ncbi:c-type cytochrome [Aestuariivirga sp.]|uniref:c-type cytochrome n=1 Tax=Aestuariivirga sp. TaxID=2650926 RepID=UPI003593D06F